MPMDKSNQAKQYFRDVDPYQYIMKIGDKFFFNNLKKGKNMRKV
jgi:hypothetical protein